MISNEFAVKLCLEYEEKNGEKVVKKELLVALRGELYFFINPEEDDVEPGVVFVRLVLRLTKGIIDFGNRILTIYPYLISFNDDLDDELDALLASIDVSDLPPLDITDILPFMCSMGKSAGNKKQPLRNYKMSYNGALPVPLQHAEWKPNHFGNFAKENGDGKWHTKIRVMDLYGNIFEQGYETKSTDRKLSEYYKLSDIMSSNWF
ncbi:hypothetical protein Tco_1446852 [Tanacetum coccineum]